MAPVHFVPLFIFHEHGDFLNMENEEKWKMYIKMTEHYKGRYPVDLGGLTMNGPKPKEIDDRTGRLIADANYPIAVECTKDGVALREVPPVEAPKVEAAAAVVEEKVEAVTPVNAEEAPVEGVPTLDIEVKKPIRKRK